MTGAVPIVAAAGSACAGVAGVRRLVEAQVGARIALRVPVLVTRTDRGRRLATSLDRAGVRCGADAFVLIVAAAAVLAGGLAWAVVRSPVVAVVGAGAVAVGAAAFVGSAEQRYLSRFAAQLPLVAQQLSSALGAGLSLRQAVGRAAADTPEPAAAELRQVARELELGARTEDALRSMADRLPDPGVRIMVTAILVQRVVGGNLAQALGDLSARLEERGALVREARSATAQARMSAWLVAGLPLAGGVMVEIASPGTLARIVGRGPGLALLLMATVLEVAGVLVIRRIVRHQDVW